MQDNKDKAKVYKAEELRLTAKSATINQHSNQVVGMLNSIMAGMLEEAQAGNYALDVEFTDTPDAVIATLAVLLQELGYHALRSEKKLFINWNAP